MLISTKKSDSQKPFYAAVLIVSIIVHAAILSQLQWQVRVPQKTETVFEVQLLEPEVKPVPAKKKSPPPAVKPKPLQVTPEKPKLVEEKKAPQQKSGEPDIVLQSPEKKEIKEPPKTVPKPLLKPSLAIRSDIEPSRELNRNNQVTGAQNPAVLAEKPLVESIKPPDTKASETAAVPEENRSLPSLSIDPDDVKRLPRNETLDSGQIASSERTDDITAEITSKKENIRYRIVKQEGEGKTTATGSNEKGDSMIEGEIGKRKIIYKPDPPVLNLEKDVTVTLKFTVLPNGEVDQIFPFRKAEPELEKLAMQLLRQYRFEPLFENDQIQHGIIHFSIYRNR